MDEKFCCGWRPAWTRGVTSLAAAIRVRAHDGGVEPAGTESFESVTGKGVKDAWMDAPSAWEPQSLREHGIDRESSPGKAESAAQGRADVM